jgi:P-type Cu+ transporter
MVRLIYTCPMHPEIEQDFPWTCPLCGMALEPKDVRLEESDGEYRDMLTRFWAAAVLTVLVLYLSGMIPGLTFSPAISRIGQFAFSTPNAVW